ncbi:MAG: hypothetical protein JXQ65_14905 [Candidatus Marinimicrobia bacterium]|nr:hypothetical protein [Candidatus Neomarinimicrobiota bacterium]
MKNMILASKDSLFLVNNALFFKKFGYNVIHANDFMHAMNNIKTLADTNEKVNILIIKSREFNEDDHYFLNKIFQIDRNIMVFILANRQLAENDKIHFLDYNSSPMEIIENLNKK